MSNKRTCEAGVCPASKSQARRTSAVGEHGISDEPATIFENPLLPVPTTCKCGGNTYAGRSGGVPAAWDLEQLSHPPPSVQNLSATSTAGHRVQAPLASPKTDRRRAPARLAPLTSPTKLDARETRSCTSPRTQIAHPYSLAHLMTIQDSPGPIADALVRVVPHRNRLGAPPEPNRAIDALARPQSNSPPATLVPRLANIV